MTFDIAKDVEAPARAVAQLSGTQCALMQFPGFVLRVSVAAPDLIASLCAGDVQLVLPQAVAPGAAADWLGKSASSGIASFRPDAANNCTAVRFVTRASLAALVARRPELLRHLRAADRHVVWIRDLPAIVPPDVLRASVLAQLSPADAGALVEASVSRQDLSQTVTLRFAPDQAPMALQLAQRTPSILLEMSGSARNHLQYDCAALSALISAERLRARLALDFPGGKEDDDDDNEDDDDGGKAGGGAEGKDAMQRADRAAADARDVELGKAGNAIARLQAETAEPGAQVAPAQRALANLVAALWPRRERKKCCRSHKLFELGLRGMPCARLPACEFQHVLQPCACATGPACPRIHAADMRTLLRLDAALAACLPANAPADDFDVLLTALAAHRRSLIAEAERLIAAHRKRLDEALEKVFRKLRLFS